MKRLLLALALLVAAAKCIDFQEAENHYCGTHGGICPDAGTDDSDAGNP